MKLLVHRTVELFHKPGLARLLSRSWVLEGFCQKIKQVNRC